MFKKKKIIYISLALIPFLGIILYFNLKLYSAPDFNHQGEVTNDVVKQLNFLENELKNENLGIRMQQIYPEGFVFIHALYGLTWTEVAMSANPGSPLYDHSLSEAIYAYNEINSEYGRSVFEKGLNPEYGMYYRGWENFLLSQILKVQPDRDSNLTISYKQNCLEISNAIQACRSPYPESYPNAAWPADAFVAVASLKQYDELFGANYETIIHIWVDRVKKKLNAGNPMIPHSVDAITGDQREIARGSSSSLILIFLADIDPVFASNQFKLFSSSFQLTRFGLPAIMEYPNGHSGKGDIDSGPVIMDIGLAATIVSVGTFKKFGEKRAAEKLSASVESFGFPICCKNSKRYLFGSLPIADAFIAWTRMQEVNKKVVIDKGTYCLNSGSFFWFHFYCTITIILILVLFLRREIVEKFKYLTK